MLAQASDAERLLTGPEKAATLLLALGPAMAGRLLKHLDPPDLRSVTRAAAGLGAVAPAMLDVLVDEFAECFSAGMSLLGDVGRTRTLLAGTLPAGEIDTLIESVLAPTDEQDVWQALAKIPERMLVEFLMAERPTAATYIVSRLDSALAARIVSALPRGRRNVALCGLIAPHSVSARAAEVVEDALRAMLGTSATRSEALEGPARIAGIINNLEPDDAEDVMRANGEARPKDAAVLKRLLFSFNDLPSLSERARSLLFDRASIDVVVMALRGTDTEFRNSVLSSMPARGRRLVESELSSGASAAPKEIAKARKAIADIVLGMAARNEIELAGADADGP